MQRRLERVLGLLVLVEVVCHGVTRERLGIVGLHHGNRVQVLPILVYVMRQVGHLGIVVVVLGIDDPSILGISALAHERDNGLLTRLAQDLDALDALVSHVLAHGLFRLLLRGGPRLEVWCLYVGKNGAHQTRGLTILAHDELDARAKYQHVARPLAEDVVRGLVFGRSYGHEFELGGLVPADSVDQAPDGRGGLVPVRDLAVVHLLANKGRDDTLALKRILIGLLHLVFGLPLV